jgi:hypothetical protein
MRRTFYLLLLFTLLACTKEKDHPSILGKWMDIELIDDIGGQKVSDPLKTFIEFRQDGTFRIDTSNVYTYYKSALYQYSRYKAADDKILFYNDNASDTLTIRYLLQEQLWFNYGRVGEKFTRRF